MGQNDIQWLQDENTILREENATLRALVKELLPLKIQVEQLSTQIKQLENRLAKDSHNSHLPPSSDRFARQPKPKSLRKASGKKPGAQEGHPGNTLSQRSDPDQIIVHPVQECATCHQDLSQDPPLMIERRQVFDIPPKWVIVIEHQAEQKCCPQCHEITKASFPQGVSAPVQYGPAYAALGVYLVHQQLLPYARACETIQDLIGPAMTVGTLKALVGQCAQELKPVEERIKEALRKSPVLHQDETGLYVMGKRYWLHGSVTKTLTHYAVHPKRGAEALDAIGILAGFTGISVHDGWATYWQYLCLHALCNVHHLRELVFLSEQGQQWATKMIRGLLAMNEAVKEARTQGLTSLDPQIVATWKEQYHLIIQEGWQSNPPDPPLADGLLKRGRRKQSASRNLLQRLDSHQDAVLRFLENFDVPFDNSQAERDIRMMKVQQKVSGGFRTLVGAEDFCRIRGYLSTLRKQGGHVLTALELAFVGHPISPSF